MTQRTIDYGGKSFQVTGPERLILEEPNKPGITYEVDRYYITDGVLKSTVDKDVALLRVLGVSEGAAAVEEELWFCCRAMYYYHEEVMVD